MKRVGWIEVRGWSLTSPYLVFTIAFFILPLIWGIFLLFTDWNLISPQKEFIGLRNFFEAFKSSRVLAAFFTSYKVMAIFIPTVLISSLGIALLINSIPRFKGLISVCFFLPYLASGVAFSLVVKGVLAYNSPLSPVFRQLFGYIPDWLGNPILAVIVISLMITWKFSGYYALIFLAGLQSIPNELYEAADIDGAGFWTKLWKITIPMLYPAQYTVMILAVGLMFGIFTEPYMLTAGGPELATHTWYLEIYYQAFSAMRAGYASAVALINAIVTFISILFIRRIMEGWGKAHG
ncbi:MAG: carbohydrate ABC transporter permease [Candidatus Bipolaricaulia bacterium]